MEEQIPHLTEIAWNEC